MADTRKAMECMQARLMRQRTKENNVTMPHKPLSLQALGPIVACDHDFVFFIKKDNRLLFETATTVCGRESCGSVKMLH